MSHFTHMKTRFQNLFYLEKALNRLNINYKREKKIFNNSDSKFYTVSQKIGFQPIKYQQNIDGSNTLILERWNTEKN